ncbi:hypothetical protein ACROYT_G043800 [Oculina patagonica]
MKQEDRSVMTSAVRRLGQEISKLGLRMRNRSPSGSDSDVFCSTDELAAKGAMDGQAEKTFSEDSFEKDGASGSCDSAQPAKQRRHSRNELDEDVEFKERRSSIKAALRPVLSRKSRSDLAKYSRPNQDLNLKQETLRRNGSENSIKENVKENRVDGIRTDKNGKGEGKDAEIPSTTYRVATKSQVAEHVDKTTKPRRPRRPKRSKSFSGLLNWRGAKQAQKEASGSNGCNSVTVEYQRRAIRRSNSFSGKVENSKQTDVDNSNPRTLQMQTFTAPDRNERSSRLLAGDQESVFSDFDQFNTTLMPPHRKPPLSCTA